MVLLQILDVPGSWESLFVYGLQVIATLPGVMDDPVGSLPYGVKFPLGRVLGCRVDFAQDEVSYVKSSEFHPPIVVFVHLLLVLYHPVKSFFSNLI